MQWHMKFQVQYKKNLFAEMSALYLKTAPQLLYKLLLAVQTLHSQHLRCAVYNSALLMPQGWGSTEIPIQSEGMHEGQWRSWGV